MPVNLKGKPPALQVKTMKVADLKEYENNPRKNDAAVPKMVGLIEKFGFRQPILVRGDQIVDGHLRIKAARKMGLQTVPALEVGNMPEEDVRALRLAMNKSVEWAEWDTAALAKEFEAIKESGLELTFTGFDTSAVDKVLESMHPKPKVPKSAQADAGTPADPNYVSLTFHMSASGRKKVMARLDALMAEHGLENRSQALLHLCK